MSINISAVIAEVLGIFFIVMGASVVVNTKETAVVLEEAARNKGYLWLWGLFALITGAVIVALNNTWTSGLPLVITVLGWAALAKGAFILIFPGATASLYRKFGTSSMMAVAGVVALVIGFALVYA